MSSLPALRPWPLALLFAVACGGRTVRYSDVEAVSNDGGSSSGVEGSRGGTSVSSGDSTAGTGDTGVGGSATAAGGGPSGVGGAGGVSGSSSAVGGAAGVSGSGGTGAVGGTGVGGTCSAGGSGIPNQCGSPGIVVISASYGSGNCGTAVGNVTGPVAGECNSLMTCDVFVHNSVFGDPAYGCPKDFTVAWTCGGNPSVYTAGHGPIEGEGYSVSLVCP